MSSGAVSGEWEEPQTIVDLVEFQAQKIAMMNIFMAQRGLMGEFEEFLTEFQAGFYR